MDTVRRVLMYNGYSLKGMMNITDVGHLVSDGDDGEDKLVKAGREAQLSPYEIADKISAAFFEDLKKLNIGRPEIVEKATDHIDEMLSFVCALIDKGFAYETGDGIYFDISKFPSYGKLSGQKLDENIAGARVGINDEKRHPADFAIWKKAPKEHIMQWPSRFGMGFPGWHIECSALGRKFLGDCFDIHTGGIDHIPIHHENEIAQTEALTGRQAVNYWMHGEFMQVDGGKMSKSLGNTYTVADLQSKGYDPLCVRYFCLNTHYRKALNFTFEALNGARTAYDRLLNLIVLHKDGTFVLGAEKIAGYKAEFLDAVSDDINIPLALGLLWTMLKNPPSRDIYALALEFDKVLGLDLDKAYDKVKGQSFAAKEGSQSEHEIIPLEIAKLLERRAQARKEKDFKKSDELRDQIAVLGYTVVDSKDGQILKKSV
ncbi:cysteinyl-trna synthetase [Holotrichia oblita]|nr:cysteinyl-trna synthetase [Holotrichia oblita]